MIIVLADVRIRDGDMTEALAISRRHVERSRREPGCVSHDVLIDPGHDHRLMFVERWVDRAALDEHFAVAESIEFARRLGLLAAERPHMQILPIEPRDG